MIYQTLYFDQLIVFHGGGRFQSLTDGHVFPAQSLNYDFEQSEVVRASSAVKKIDYLYFVNKSEEQKEYRPADRHDLNALWYYFNRRVTWDTTLH